MERTSKNHRYVRSQQRHNNCRLPTTQIGMRSAKSKTTLSSHMFFLQHGTTRPSLHTGSPTHLQANCKSTTSNYTTFRLCLQEQRMATYTSYSKAHLTMECNQTTIAATTYRQATCSYKDKQSFDQNHQHHRRNDGIHHSKTTTMGTTSISPLSICHPS